MGKTLQVVTCQLEAMGSRVFEVGLFKPDEIGGSRSSMIPRTWDCGHLLSSVSWMRLQNLNGRNIYIRPGGEHDLTLVDDLKADSLRQMEKSGFRPALVVETSPNNFQAWLKHSRVLSREVSTAAARQLAIRFDGDTGAADWRHFGRLAGFTNRKVKYQSDEGLFPFVRLSSASGRVYDQAGDFISQVEAQVSREQERRRERRATPGSSAPGRGTTRSIADFWANPAYGGDKTRSDLAYAIYALSRGLGEDSVAQALRGRDLRHKGNEKRQTEYINRTIKKAVSLAGTDRCLVRS